MRLVMVGNGSAGVTTSRLVAGEDSTIAISLYSDEPYLYYQRPRLIELIAGQVLSEDLLPYSQEWYAGPGVAAAPSTRVTGIDRHHHQTSLRDGVRVSYDRPVLAFGERLWISLTERAVNQLIARGMDISDDRASLLDQGLDPAQVAEVDSI